MSYLPITPTFYEMRQPNTPFHAGAPGWSQAPWPSWGNNPVLRGPARLAAFSGCSACGQTETGMGTKRALELVSGALSIAAVLGGIYVIATQGIRR